jgi:alpha-1,2-mannosyltransferase
LDNDAVNRSHLWLLPLLLAVLVGGAWVFGYRADKKDDRELPVYVVGGERMAAGVEIYRRGEDSKPFTYPPFAAVPFVAFAAVPHDWQPAVWFAVNFVIVLLLVRWLQGYARQDVPGRAPPRLLAFWLLTGVLGGRHVFSVLSNQSHDLFIAGLVGLAAAAWVRGRSVAGVFVGLGAAVKATPLLFLGLFGLRLRWFAIVLVLASAALATVSCDLLFPRTDGAFWWQRWFDVNLRGMEVGGAASQSGIWNSHSVLNQSLSGTLARLFTPVTGAQKFVVGEAGTVLLTELSPTVFKLVNLASQLAVLAFVTLGVLGGGRAARSAADAARAQRLVALGEVGAVVCGMVLLSPQSSKSHFCVWLFPVAYLADRLLRGPRDRLATVLLVAAAITGLLAKDVLGTKLGNQALAYGNVTWATVLLLLATVRCLWTARRTEGGSDGRG